MFSKFREIVQTQVKLNHQFYFSNALRDDPNNGCGGDYLSVRLGGKRGAGVPGYGVPGYGKRGVWKTRGLVENAGYHFFRQNMNFPH